MNALQGGPLGALGTSRRAALRTLGAGAALIGGLGAVSSANAQAMEKIRTRGSLIVAVYKDLPPFNTDGQGIDIDLAQALAQAMGLTLSLLPFNADENMNDDLRNLVWRGHYLGFGPADVLLHVPVDKPLMDATPQVKFFAPYYRESVALARSLAALPTLDAMSAIAGHKVAVAGQSLAGWLMIGADGGAYQSQLSTQWKDGAQAAQALLRGEVTVAAGNLSELESVLAKDPRFAIEPLPSPRAPRNGWAVGCAVKTASVDLAQALQGAMNGLAANGTLREMFARQNVAWRGA